MVGSAILGEFDGETVGEERELVVVEAIVFERIASPDRRLVVIGIPDLDIELGSDTQAAEERSVYVVVGSGTLVLRNVVVDDLQETIVAAVSLEIERLRLDAGLVNELPLQVFLGELRVGGIAGILAHRVDGLRAVLGLLSTGDIGQPASS